MAISYRFEIATKAPETEAAERFCDIARAGGVIASSTTSDDVREGAVTVLGTRIRVRRMNPEPFNPVVEDLGFSSTVSVSFRLGRDHGAYLEQNDMIGVVSGLLSGLSGDAVLHLHYEQIWLMRRDGDLIVSGQYDVWPPVRLAMLPPPYRRATLAFAE